MAVQQRARGVLVAAMLAALGSSAMAVQVPAAASFDEAYRRAQKINAALKTLSGRFTETTTSSLLTRPLIAHGTLAVQRPSRVILRYSEPDGRVVLIDGDRLTVTWPSRPPTHADIGRAQSRVQRYFVQGDATELRREFDIEARTASERPGTEEIRLRPKRRQIRETLAALDLWVEPTTSLLAAMRMTFANGDTKVMTFDDVIANPALDAGTFSVAR